MPSREDGPRVVLLVCDGVEVTSWPLRDLGRPDLAVLDELARLQLAARRLGCSIRLQQRRPAFLELLVLTGSPTS